MKPKLSICIPTYSRAHLLRVCLNSLLPQVERHRTQVECVVCDNASHDETRNVLMEYERRFPVRVFHNESNIGVIGNITKIIACHAQGDYVWLIGDDDVVAAGALDRIVGAMESMADVDLIALNVGFLPEAQRPTADEALGGVDVQPASVLRRDPDDKIVKFEELLTGPCADFTASYSFLLKRDLWRAHFPMPLLDEPFTSVRTTYPHASIIAAEMVGKPAGYLAAPSVLVYELPAENYSWARYHSLNTLLHATQLLQLYQQNGVPRSRLEPYFRHQVTQQGNALGDLVWNKNSAGGIGAALGFLWLTKRYPWSLFKVCCNAMTHDATPSLLSLPFRVGRFLMDKCRVRPK